MPADPVARGSGETERDDSEQLRLAWAERPEAPDHAPARWVRRTFQLSSAVRASLARLGAPAATVAAAWLLYLHRLARAGRARVAVGGSPAAVTVEVLQGATFREAAARLRARLEAARGPAPDSEWPLAVVIGASALEPGAAPPGWHTLLVADDGSVQLIHDARRYDSESLVVIEDHFQVMLHAAAADPDRSLASLPLVDERELNRLVVEWNATQEPGPDELCVHELFERMVKKTPTAAALLHGERTFSYRELDLLAESLARRLRARGVRPEVVVGLLAGRSVEAVVAILAIMKAGGAYVPLDPTHPRERIAYMLADAGAALVVSVPPLAKLVPPDALVETIVLAELAAGANAAEDAPAARSCPQNAAYVIFTSGSTGRPKGVLVEHRSAVNAITSMWRFGFGARHRMLQQTNLTFDPSVNEIFAPLSTGGAVVVFDGDPDIDGLLSLLARHHVSAVGAVPALLARLNVEKRSLPELKLVFSGGDAVALRDVDSLLRSTRVCNGYGPTETTICATAFDISPLAPDASPRIPIGKPLHNCQVYVLDQNLACLPAGIPGEICISGAGVARGYVNHPELTAERFVPHPFTAGERLYRTGDLGRLLPDGNIEFLGRLDDQVKIRGYRVELEEVKSALAAHPAVREAVVLAKEGAGGARQLVGFYAPRSASAAELRAFLRARLPAYMVPTTFVALDRLPLQASGKVDRRALAAFDLKENVARELMPPATALEETLAIAWAEALGLERVGTSENLFDLGAESLVAMRVTAKLRERGIELPLGVIFRAPTVLGMAAALDTSRAPVGLHGLKTITPSRADRAAPFPLTDVQHAYWVGRAEGFELGGTSVHVYLELEFPELDLERFERVVERLIRRHDMLRVVVRPDGLQEFREDVPRYQVKTTDLRGCSPEAARRHHERVRAELSHQIFQTETWPLFELRAARLDGGRVRLYLSHDVIIADASSYAILIREFVRLYPDPEATLPALELSFRDYVLASRQLEGTDAYRRDRDYWMARLPELLPGPQLPLAAAASPQRPTFVRRLARLSADEWDALRRRAAAAGLPPSVAVLSAFADVLAAWSKSPRFTLNLTLFNPLPIHPQVQDIVGDFTTLTMLAVDASGGDSFAARARRLGERLWADLDHRHFTGVRVLRELLRRQPGTVMPVVFTWISGVQARPERTPGVPVPETVFGITQSSQVWLDHQVWEETGGLSLCWDGPEGLFPPGMVDDMFDAYVRHVRRLAAGDAAWEEARPALVPARQLATRQAIHARVPIPDELLHTRFLSLAKEAPERPAIVTTSRTLSYGELARRALTLGRELRELGARPDRLVAVLMEKGWEQPVGALAVLCAGAAYLPIDAELPAERRWHLLERGQVELVVTQERLDERLEWPDGIKRLRVTSAAPAAEPLPLAPAQRPSDLAYVIFTSGSTGTPKGVMIEHRAAWNTVADIQRRFAVGPEDRVLALSSLSFDLSVYDLFGPLSLGGAVVLPEASEAREPARWAELMGEHGVTVWNSVPQLLQMFLDGGHEDEAPVLRLVMLSGDWIPLELARRALEAFPKARLVSLGGATEASIWSIFHPIAGIDPAWRSIPYGRPLANQTFHVYDEALAPRPDWVPGELYIGGAGVARGYFREPEKTAASFLVHPGTGERLYRTGDFGRYHPEGDIEFLGREDSQVKIRGFRVELGEIEAALAGHPDVQAVAVEAVGERAGNRRLVAYVVAKPEALDGGAGDPFDALREFLNEKLPAYMVPSQFVRLAQLPLTANGKVDRKALPSPDGVAGETAPEYVAPRSPVEQTLAAIWADVLGRERIGVDDNFFAMGGDSILSVQIVARAREAGLELSAAQLFRHQSIASLAQVADPAASTSVRPPLVRRGPVTEAPLTFAQEMQWNDLKGNPGTTYHNRAQILRWRGPLDADALARAVAEVIRRHVALRTSFASARPVARIAPVGEPAVPIVDCRSAPDPDAEVRRRVLAEVRKPHDWSAVSMFHPTLYRLAADDHVLLLSYNHAILDGLSMAKIEDELEALYAAFAQRRPSPLPEPTLQHSDYAHWQKDWLKGEEYERQLSFWRRRYAGSSPLVLPTDHPRTAARSVPRTATVKEEIPVSLAGAVSLLAVREGVSPYMVQLGATALVLHHRLRATDLLLCVIASDHPAVAERAVGKFTTVYNLRFDLSGDPTASALLGHVRDVMVESSERSSFPSWRGLPPAVTQVMDATFTYLPRAKPELSLPGGVRGTREAYEELRPLPLFDFEWYIWEGEDSFTIEVAYDPALFEAATMTRMIADYVRVLEMFARAPERSIAEICLHLDGGS